MSEQQQTKPDEGSQQRSYHDVAKGMNAFFPGQADEQPDNEEPTEPDATQQDPPEDEELDAQAEQPEPEGEEDVSDVEDAEAADEETSESDFRLTLTVNGEEVVVEDEDEARSLAQRGKHYTQEMQKLREEQREWETQRQEHVQELRQQQDQYAAALETLQQTFGAALGEEPDWGSEEMRQLRTESPQQYAQLRDQWDQLHAIQAERQRIQQERRQEQMEQLREQAQQEADQLQAKKPEWSDPQQKQQDYELIRDYALEQGVSEKELQNFLDHRVWLILHDAARYREAQSTGKKQVKKAKKTKTASPGSKQDQTESAPRKYRKVRENLKETGDTRAAGELFQQLLTKQG